MRFNNLFYSAAFLCAGTSATADEFENYSNIFGIAYTPYKANGTCKSSDEIASEFSKLSNFFNVRLYDVDCDQVKIALKSKSSYQKLFVGIRNFENPSSSIDILVDAVKEAGSWDDIDTVALGNELIEGKVATLQQVTDGLKSLKTTLRSRGYNGPVVTVDTYNSVLENPNMCNISDYIVINADPNIYFNFKRYIAGDWVREQILKLSAFCGGKRVFVTDVGLPHNGDHYGMADVNIVNERMTIVNVGGAARLYTYLSSAFDQQLKKK